MKHRNLPLAVTAPERSLTAPDVRYLNSTCDGTVRTLYVRLLRPQRWIQAGWVCDTCGKSHVVDRAELSRRRAGQPRA